MATAKSLLSSLLRAIGRDKKPTPEEAAKARALQRAADEYRQRQEADARELAWRRELDEEELIAELQQTAGANLERDPAVRWARSGAWYEGFPSSNVRAMQYEADDERLLVQYRDGSLYAYKPVPIDLALTFYRAPSKGTWIWDNARERGTVFGYKIPYELISGPSQRTLGVEARRWMATQESRRKHGDIGPSGRDARGRTIKPRDLHRP